MDFPTFVQKNDPKQLTPMPKCLIALDPGETTGYAVFIDGKLLKRETTQLATHTIAISVPLLMNRLKQLSMYTYPQQTRVVYEAYRVYAWKAQGHSWDTLHTPRLIGCIQTLCTLLDIPIISQMAQQPKQFCTDQKLKLWGYYQPGMRHARDAIRHGCYYILFNHKKYRTAITS